MTERSPVASREGDFDPEGKIRDNAGPESRSRFTGLDCTRPFTMLILSLWKEIASDSSA